MVNDQSKHKLNNRNFKTIRLFIRLLNFIFIRISDRFLLLFIFDSFVVLIFSRSITIIILSPLAVYVIYVYMNLLIGLLLFIYISMIYYWTRFKQINARIRLFSKQLSQRIIQMIKERNEISAEIHKLNLLMNKSVTCLFLITAGQFDLLIYLSLYTDSMIHKTFFFLVLFGSLICISSIHFPLIILTKSAHQSYNIMYSIIKRKTLSYRIRFKVSYNYNFRKN